MLCERRGSLQPLSERRHCLAWAAAPSPGDCRHGAPHGTWKPITGTSRILAVPLCIRCSSVVVSPSDLGPIMRCDSDPLHGIGNITSLNGFLRELNEIRINSALRLVFKM